jgi:hypothetical protein
MTQLDLHDTQILADLQAALGRFTAGAQESLRLAEAEIGRTREWLHERVGHWQREVERAQREVARAEAALRRCLASGYRDERGYYHQPDCSCEARAVERAYAFSRECENNLHTAQLWHSRVEQAVNEYQRAARRLADVADAHTGRARAFIGRARAQYDAVLAAGRAVGDLVADLVAVAGVLSRAPGLAGGVTASLRATVGRVWPARGALGEEINVSAALEELGLKEVRFDQAKHGFDRILRGPAGQIIVLESKTSDEGKLVLETRAGGYKQGSAAWVEHIARQMTDPTSELWSQDNERIGRQILEQGPEKVPVLAAVLNPNTGVTDIYLRTDAAAEEWTLLSGQLLAGGEP